MRINADTIWIDAALNIDNDIDFFKISLHNRFLSCLQSVYNLMRLE